uniref:Reverse transcriptase zinc-binding domain-containing protein n=1 Tax=Cannabis sativa TaxID=3483 RepID=A0A803QN61_CANSA
MHLSSWEKVCLPKKYGGFAFREGRKWNTSLMAKFVWAISSKQDNLWVRWINANYLKGKDFWQVEFKSDASWYFKKLLRLRSTIDRSDIVNACKSGKFKTSIFYISANPMQKVDYTSQIWHKMCIPKHRFIGWQAINNQLLARDHISKIMPIPDVLCPVCLDDKETHAHIFMDCPYTLKVVTDVSKWLGRLDWPKNSRDWYDWFSKPLKNLQEKLFNVVCLAIVYNIWVNRNNCIFELRCKSVSCISMDIKKVVKYRCLDFVGTSKNKLDAHFCKVIASW